jgi:hypothetical protein
MPLHMPAGTYFVGDPVYVFEHDDPGWQELCQKMEKRGCPIRGCPRSATYVVNGRKLAVMFTTLNDCTHVDDDGNTYYVISQTLGMAQVSPEWRPRSRKWGRVLTFNEPFTCSYNHGVLDLGGVYIGAR